MKHKLTKRENLQKFRKRRWKRQLAQIQKAMTGDDVMQYSLVQGAFGIYDLSA